MSATALIGVGVGLSIFGGVMSFTANQQMRAEQLAYSKQAENIKNQQMMLDSTRRKRAVLRQGLINRAMAISNAANQGASTSDSGVLGGAGGAVSSSLGGQKDTNSATILGSRSFSNNQGFYDATSRGQFWASLGEGISNVGGAITGNASTISSLGQDYFKPRYGSAYTGGWGSTAWS